MVHALKEAWRVLVPQGTMIDLRPLSINTTLEVTHAEVVEAAGLVDMSPGLKYDRAVDQAIDTVLAEGIFTQFRLEIFEYVDYWKTYHGMVADFNERWKDEIIVTNEDLARAKLLYKQNYPHTRMRLPMQMKLAAYIKN